jgi:hypothetical protein
VLEKAFGLNEKEVKHIKKNFGDWKP